MARRWSLLVVVMLAVGAAPASKVTVKKAAPAVETRTFDPKTPPGEMPKLTPPEVAVASSSLRFEVQFTYVIAEEQKKDGLTVATIRITGAQVDLGLNVVIWLPTKSDAKTRDHEEAHRRISEHFYESADTVARELASKYIGQTYSGTSGSADGAADKALSGPMQKIGQEYMTAVHEPMKKAQAAFDRITDHGRNRVPEEKGIAQAIAEVEKTP